VGRDRQVRFAQRGPSDGEGVDGVGLAPGAGGAALLGHQLRRHPHHRLTRVEQVDLQPRREMAAVLDRPQQFAAEPLLGPPDRLVVALRGGPDGDSGELAAGLVDRDEGVGALVHIRSDDNHGGCLLSP
jgi:hypothetical protein